MVDLLVQLCGGDGGAVVVGMMSQAFPAGMGRKRLLHLWCSSVNTLWNTRQSVLIYGDSGGYVGGTVVVGVGRRGPRQTTTTFSSLS